MERVVAALIGAGFGWLLGHFSPTLQHFVGVWLRGPKLKCRTIAAETPTNVPGTRHWYASVAVSNVKSRIARQSRVFLTTIERLQSNGSSKVICNRTIQCIWEYDAQRDSFDIPYGANPECNFAMVEEGTPGFRPQLRRSDGAPLVLGPYSHEFACNGTYRFRGVVTAEDVSAVRFCAEIEFTGTWPPKLTNIE